ncbi:site-specific integrase [Streptomyces sp. NPDC052051]|uniref:tyrosine-type recombinase/integrase n=1 Tax=Streptomyces sp. NPDC052051 TaxID=3154649 RepID=UPI00341E1DEF
MNEVTTLPLHVIADPARRRETRDRLEVLTALLGAPHVDPIFGEAVVRFPGDHPVFGWLCLVNDCVHSRTNTRDLCHPHALQWQRGRRDNPALTRREFLRTATPQKFFDRLSEPPDCRICPERPARHHELRLCLTHLHRWNKSPAARQGQPFEDWLAENNDPLPGYGDCLVTACASRSESPLGLCFVHELRYAQEGRPGGAKRPRGWNHRTEKSEGGTKILYEDRALFRRWCATTHAISRTGTVNLLGLPPLVRAEFQWGMFTHTQKANHTYWPNWWLQKTANLARERGVASLLDLAPERSSLNSRDRMILREILNELRIVYFTMEETKEAGFIETEHFGVRYPQRQSNFDLTGVTQRWLRDLLWEHLAARLRSPQTPRSTSFIDCGRRACVELSVFLEAAAPGGGHDPTVLTEEHMRRFIADHSKRAREGLPSLGIVRSTGKPSIVTPHTRRFVFNHARMILRDAMENGTAEEIGLSRKFITELPTGGATVQRARSPFPDAVARALAAEANLQLFAARYDPNDHGLRDAWEALVFTGRRAMEILELRLECMARHGGAAFLWHDQTKVGNFDEAIRIPERLYLRLEQRKQRTLERFEDRHGRPPAPRERKDLALFPSPSRNPRGRVSVSYTFFHTGFTQWLGDLDLGGAYVPHQARHTLATNLLKHGAGLHHIKQYLGQVSPRMAEHYAKVASSEIEDVLYRVWVGGPGSAEPGQLLASPTEGMSRAEAQAMAIDLSRRSTPAEGGHCTFQPVVRGEDCPFGLDCQNCDKFVMSGADLLYWRRKAEQWRSMAERAPTDEAADYLHQLFEPTARAIDGLEKALAALGLLEDALAMDLRRPQDYFQRMWSLAFKASDLAELADNDPDLDLDGLTEDFA